MLILKRTATFIFLSFSVCHISQSNAPWAALSSPNSSPFRTPFLDSPLQCMIESMFLFFSIFFNLFSDRGIDKGLYIYIYIFCLSTGHVDYNQRNTRRPLSNYLVKILDVFVVCRSLILLFQNNLRAL